VLGEGSAGDRQEVLDDHVGGDHADFCLRLIQGSSGLFMGTAGYFSPTNAVEVLDGEKSSYYECAT